MKDNSGAEPRIKVTAQERLHPAIRKLGRACIALTRWQREQASKPAETPSNTPSSDPPKTPAPRPLEADDQEARDA